MDIEVDRGVYTGNQDSGHEVGNSMAVDGASDGTQGTHLSHLVVNGERPLGPIDQRQLILFIRLPAHLTA